MNSIEVEQKLFFHTYKRLPLDIVRGDGAYLYDRSGVKYLDMFAGIAVNALGHRHPAIIAAIRNQIENYIHLSNYFIMEPQLQLAELLLKYSGFKKVFFTNSGTEAVEGAMKIVRLWGSTRAKLDIVAFSNAFHGRTFGALSLMDRDKYKSGFGPFLSHCSTIPSNSVEALTKTVNEHTAAVILEFVKGEGGIRPVTAEFVEALKSLRQRFDFLVIADEIQAGIGRTGTFLSFEHFNIIPDIAVLAKPIGGGLPLGAILGSEKIADILEPGKHGTTFGGNPVACAAGVAVINEIMNKGVLENTKKVGAYFLEQLKGVQSTYPTLIKEVRGFGLMIGVELTRDADPIVTAMREKKVLVNGTDQTVLRFVPALTVTEQQVKVAVDALRSVLAEIR
jgi:acetylornithine aminotransferase